MAKTSIIGIDPGKQGAVALLCDDPQTTLFWLLSEIEEQRGLLGDIVAQYDVRMAFVEKAQAMPGQGVSSMFNYGMGFGKILGWLEMLYLPYTLVHPKTWTKAIHSGCTGSNAKEKSLQAVQRLFPKEDLKSGVRLHPGLVDALLIAEFGRRSFR